MKKNTQPKQFQSNDTYKDVRRRAEKTMLAKVEKHLYNLGYNTVRGWTAKINGIDCLRFNADGCKYCFTLSTRFFNSWDNKTEIIDRGKKNKLVKIAAQFDLMRHLVLYTDGKVAEIDIVNAGYDEDKQYCPKKTVKEGEKDYTMKNVCVYSQHLKNELSFFADWVYNGKHKVVVAESTPQTTAKSLF